MHLINLTYYRSLSQILGKAEKQQLYRELKNCLDILEPIDGGKPLAEAVSFYYYESELGLH